MSFPPCNLALERELLITAASGEGLAGIPWVGPSASGAAPGQGPGGAQKGGSQALGPTMVAATSPVQCWAGPPDASALVASPTPWKDRRTWRSRWCSGRSRGQMTHPGSQTQETLEPGLEGVSRFLRPHWCLTLNQNYFPTYFFSGREKSNFP